MDERSIRMNESMNENQSKFLAAAAPGGDQSIHPSVNFGQVVLFFLSSHLELNECEKRENNGSVSISHFAFSFSPSSPSHCWSVVTSCLSHLQLSMSVTCVSVIKTLTGLILSSISFSFSLCVHLLSNLNSFASDETKVSHCK